MKRHILLCAVAAITASLNAAVEANASAVTIGTHYQEGSTRTSEGVPTQKECRDISFCYVLFNVIPAGKQLVITDVSCLVDVNWMGAADLMLTAQIATFSTAGAETDRRHALLPTTLGAGAGAKSFIVKDTTRQLLKAGERPVVIFQTSPIATSFSGVLCSISGTLGNPPQ